MASIGILTRANAAKEHEMPLHDHTPDWDRTPPPVSNLRKLVGSTFASPQIARFAAERQ